MTYLVEILKLIAPALVILIKLIADNRAKKKRESESEERQSKRITKIENELRNIFAKISIIENDSRELNELHKNKRYEENLFTEVEQRIYYLTENSNSEKQQALLSGFELVQPVLKNIITSNFTKVNKTYLFNVLVRKAKAVRAQININNLDVSDKEFLKKYKEKLKSEFRDFSADIVTLENLPDVQKKEKFRSYLLNLTSELCKF